MNFGSYIPFNKKVVEPPLFSDSEQVALEDGVPCMLHQKCCEVMSKGWLKWLLLLMEKTWARLEIRFPFAALPARQRAEANSLWRSTVSTLIRNPGRLQGAAKIRALQGFLIWKQAACLWFVGSCSHQSNGLMSRLTLGWPRSLKGKSLQGCSNFHQLEQCWGSSHFICCKPQYAW